MQSSAVDGYPVMHCNAYCKMYLLCGTVGRATDLRFTGRSFESWLTIAQWASASYLHLYASVTKWYNLVPAKEVVSGWESHCGPGGK